MESFSCIVGSSHNIISWHLDEHDSTKSLEELFFSNLHCFLELGVLVFGGRSVPLRVKSGDARAKPSRDVEPHVVSFTNTVVQSIDLKDELLVHLLVNFLKRVTLKLDTPIGKHRSCYDLLAVVLEDQTRTAQFGDIFFSVCPRLLKCSHMMVESISLYIIDSTNIHHDVKFVENIVLSSSYNYRVFEFAQLQEHCTG